MTHNPSKDEAYKPSVENLKLVVADVSPIIVVGQGSNQLTPSLPLKISCMFQIYVLISFPSTNLQRPKMQDHIFYSFCVFQELASRRTTGFASEMNWLYNLEEIASCIENNQLKMSCST